MKECPTCGAPLNVKGNTVFCEYCSKTVSGETPENNKKDKMPTRQFKGTELKFYALIVLIFIAIFVGYILISFQTLKIHPSILILLSLTVFPIILITFHKFAEKRVADTLAQFNDYDLALELNRFDSWKLKFNIVMIIIVLISLIGIAGDCYLKKKKANQTQNIKDEQRREINRENIKRF